MLGYNRFDLVFHVNFPGIRLIEALPLGFAQQLTAHACEKPYGLTPL